jgi:hypothetical protein
LDSSWFLRASLRAEPDLWFPLGIAQLCELQRLCACNRLVPSHLSCLALTLGFTVDSMAQARPPQILYISRDYLKADAVTANRRLERRAEDLCRTLGFTHPYLTIESVSEPAEMWYLNGFESQAEVEKLTREYQQNTKLLAALNDISQQKVALKRQDSTEEFAHFRSDLSSGDPLIIGRRKFFVIVFFDGNPPLNGTVFEKKDGSRMLVRTAKTASDAYVLAASAGSTARVFRSFFYFRPQGYEEATIWLRSRNH